MILYLDGKKTISDDDFLEALRQLGLQPGDVLFVHSDISVFGKLATEGKSQLLEALVGIFKKAVGKNGMIIMPTFSYSFYRDKVFDIEKTRSEVGVLTEYFRKQEGVLRTAQPNHSVAIFGKKKEEMVKVGIDCFDGESIFGKLKEAGGKIVIFGAPFLSCTFIHSIEQSHGVPYRYLKTFSGTIINRDVSKREKSTFYVRRSENKIKTDLSRLESYLLENGYMKGIKLGNGKIMVVDADILFREGMKLLDQDINFFIRIVPVSKIADIIFSFRRLLGEIEKQIKNFL